MRNYDGDSIMGPFIQDAVYGALNEDADLDQRRRHGLQQPGRHPRRLVRRRDRPGVWALANTPCQMGGIWAHDPLLLTYGNMFQILPFGNATAVGDMTGAQIYDLLNQSATLFKGAIQPAGIRFKFFRYSDALPGPQPYGWGAYDVEVWDKATSAWVPLDMDKTYQVATNEFLAPAGQDGFTPFKYMTNITYWGDMLNQVNAYVAANYGTPATAYKGPDGDGTLDGRITRNGDGDNTYEAGEVVPLTVLHHNDSHGRLLQSGTYVGYTHLVDRHQPGAGPQPGSHPAAVERRQHPGRLDDVLLQVGRPGLRRRRDRPGPRAADQPADQGVQRRGLRRLTLGNHEFNFGAEIFSTLAQATSRSSRPTSRTPGPTASPPSRWSPTSRRPSARRASTWPSWASATTGCPTTSCRATSPG